MYVYDLDTAQLLRQYDVPAGTPASLVNDVAVTLAGDAFFTDSRRPILWRIGVGTKEAPGELEPWLDMSDGSIPYSDSLNFNGIVATPDGQYLIVAHTGANTLFRVDLDLREIEEVDLNVPVQRGDGLALDGATLYAVASGEIARIELGADYKSGIVLDTFSHPSFLDPTTLRKVDDRLLVVNSQVNMMSVGRAILPFTVTSILIPPQP